MKYTQTDIGGGLYLNDTQLYPDDILNIQLGKWDARSAIETLIDDLQAEADNVDTMTDVLRCYEDYMDKSKSCLYDVQNALNNLMELLTDKDLCRESLQDQIETIQDFVKLAERHLELET